MLPGDSQLKFIGGYDLSKVELPASAAPLYFGVRGWTGKFFPRNDRTGCGCKPCP
jgi:hypothetical protein